MLIDACQILRERGVIFTCEIAGAGEEELNLRQQIEKLGLQEQVKLLGIRPQGEVTKLMQSASVMAAPCVVGGDSNKDGLPTVLLEAMALGTPLHFYQFNRHSRGVTAPRNGINGGAK